MVTIAGVETRSRADKAGILPGDVLLCINGCDISDVLDYRFRLTAATVTLSLTRNGEAFAVTIHKKEYDDIGLTFETPLMDQKHSCENRCVFCFIDQLPAGMRDTLYFKDDDSRLSFLHGNYITLTNLSDRDIDRIIEMHISPVNVSVHTTNPELRVKMMRNKHAGEVLRYLDRLADAGIALCGQIVLCRGINDGAELDRTMRDLIRYVPALRSVSVVPAGLTRHREKLYPLTLFSAEESAGVIRQVEAFADTCLAKYGTRLFFCSDEFYLNAGLALHGEEYYEGYSQIENGVGMLTSLGAEFRAELDFIPEYLEQFRAPREVSVCTGAAAYETILSMAKTLEEKVPGLTIHVHRIINRFFGESVTVAGLLTGKDMEEQLRGKPLGKTLYIPSVTLRAEGDIFLDDRSPADLSAALGVPVVPVPCEEGAAFIECMLGVKL